MPLAVQFRHHDGQIQQYARPKMNKCLDTMPADELISVFRDITGSSEKDKFELSGKQISDDTLRLLVHLTVVYANEHGQPTGQELVDITVSFSYIFNIASRRLYGCKSHIWEHK